jgi:glycosyltransferase involved in cell wall biosynthesis
LGKLHRNSEQTNISKTYDAKFGLLISLNPNGFMQSILFLIPDLNYHGRARQASLLAQALPREQFAVRLLSLRGPGPFSSPLQDGTIPISGSHSRFRFPIENVYALRQLLRTERPALVHVWGLEALRAIWAATFLKRSTLPPIVLSTRAAEFKRHKLNWWERQWMRQVRRTVVPSETERLSLIAAGLPQEKVSVIRPGVPFPHVSPAVAEFRSNQGIAVDDCLFMGVGHFNSPYRFVDAFAAFDIVRGVELSMKLMLIGDGPYRARTANVFYYPSHNDACFKSLPFHPSAASLLTQADVVLVGHQRSGGTYAVLEGMAAGRPVVATNLPHLAELIRESETGFLSPAADIPTMSRIVHRLILDESLRSRIGAAARAEVETHFRVDAMSARFADVYENVLRG